MAIRNSLHHPKSVRAAARPPDPMGSAANADNAIGLVLSGYVKLGYVLGSVGRIFSHRSGNPATVGAVRWPSAGDTAGYRVRLLKLTPVHSILMVVCAEVADNYGLFTVER